jgi:hypothetical protein
VEGEVLTEVIPGEGSIFDILPTLSLRLRVDTSFVVFYIFFRFRNIDLAASSEPLRSATILCESLGSSRTLFMALLNFFLHLDNGLTCITRALLREALVSSVIGVGAVVMEVREIGAPYSVLVLGIDSLVSVKFVRKTIREPFGSLKSVLEFTRTFGYGLNTALGGTLYQYVHLQPQGVIPPFGRWMRHYAAAPYR